TTFFEPSNAVILQTVSRQPSALEARTVSHIDAGTAPSITVNVTSLNNRSLFPTGSVSVSEGSAVLGNLALSNGVAVLTLAPLAPGTHTLDVTYQGDADFEPSSGEVTLTVVSLGGLSVSGAQVREGNSGITTVAVPIMLGAPATQPVRVSFATVPGTATEGVDYEKASGVVEFAPGQTIRTIDLHVFGDLIIESDETFSIVLSDPVNATLETPSAVVVIVNDDVFGRRRPARH